MEPSVTPPTSSLKSEAHLHLYGCLDAEGLWTIGSDEARLTTHEPRMEWFATEYKKAFGVSPNWRDWWKSENGFDDFKQTFEFTKAGSFPEFQAKFNLLIALNPPRPGDYQLVKRVLETHSKAGGIKEYRTFLPMYLPEPDREAYLLGLLEEVRNHTDKNRFQPLVALSFMRTPEVADESYGWLQQFCEKNPWVSSYITGVDFCASEVGHAPKWKQNFIARLYQDNFKREKPWHVLYHVGEMWDPISLASAARWVVEACALGARRLGHAMALGVDPNILLNQSTKEPRAEFLDHILWLTQHESLLEGFGYTPSDRKDWQTYGDRHLEGEFVVWQWNQDLCDHIKHLQNALIKMTKSFDPLVEVCVTSNIRIGALTTAHQHPLRRFIDAGLQVCVATDDPGIFGIDLAYEEHCLRSVFGCDDKLLNEFEARTKHWLRPHQSTRQ